MYIISMVVPHELELGFGQTAMDEELFSNTNSKWPCVLSKEKQQGFRVL